MCKRLSLGAHFVPKGTLSLREVRMHLWALLGNIKYAFNSLVLTINWSANQPVNNLRTPVKKNNNKKIIHLSLWHLINHSLLLAPKLEQDTKTGKGYNPPILHFKN